MNIYRILKFGTGIKSKRLKLLGIWAFHILGKRYFGIFLDPVLACNFRCQMCYFSNEAKRKTYKGILSYEQIEQIASALFHRALKLQIGCGAEPTLHKDLVRIIALGKQYHVPYISLTTNGSLLNRENLEEMIKNGLNEITISTHGLTQASYERFMVNGSFKAFRQLLIILSDLKKQYNNFKVRINYTINKDNLEELSLFQEVVGETIDIIQLRPIQKIGESEYMDFDLTEIHDRYDTVLVPLIDYCKLKDITCLIPEKENIVVLNNNENTDQSLVDATYCYISPKGCWKDGFDYTTDSFESFAKKNKLGKQLAMSILEKKSTSRTNVTMKMNYKVK